MAGEWRRVCGIAMSRLAELYRQAARLDVERSHVNEAIADELERSEIRSATPVAPPPKPRRTRGPVVRRVPTSASVSEIDVARARAVAQKYRIPL